MICCAVCDRASRSLKARSVPSVLDHCLVECDQLDLRRHRVVITGCNSNARMTTLPFAISRMEVADVTGVRRSSTITASRSLGGSISFEQLQPLDAHIRIKNQSMKTGGVAARPRQAFDEAGANRVDDSRTKRSEDLSCSPLQQAPWPSVVTMRSTSGARQLNPLSLAQPLRSLAYRHSDNRSAMLRPSTQPSSRKPLPNGRVAVLVLHRSEARCQEYRCAAPSRLLRPRRKRPRRRAAEQRDEFAPFHSITSSARASRCGGTVEAERLRGLEVDHQLELGRRLHRQVARLLALEDAVDIAEAARR